MEDRCKYCQSTKFSDYLFLNGFKYKRCTKCTLVQLVPMPALDDLAKIYDRNYYAENYNVNVKEQATAIKQSSQIQYEILKRNYKIQPTTKFLDFGCGIGGFLDAVNENNNKFIYGVELNKISSEIIKKKGFGFIDDLGQSSETFDIITLWDVAEHLNDPIATFKLLKSKLNKDGILVLGTARIDDFVDKTAFGYTMWADPPGHTLLYNKKVLLKILKSSGFENNWIDNEHSIGNIYNSKYKMFKRLIKKIIFIFRTDRKNKRGDFGSYLVIIAKK